MKVITKYQSLDGSEWTEAGKALEREILCEKVSRAMLPLGDVPSGVTDGKGWLQHDLESVHQAKDAVLDLCREQGMDKLYPAFKHRGRDCHSMSINGRILSEDNGPLGKAWNRFTRIDEQGREHQQPYYAINGPLPEHVCVESRDTTQPSSVNDKHDYRTCQVEDCEECQQLVNYGLVMACDGCGMPGRQDCDAWTLLSDGSTLCMACFAKVEPSSVNREDQ